MIRARYVAVAGAAVVAALGLLWPRGSSIVVEPGMSVQQVIDAAAPGTVVVLAPGIHQGPITVTTAVDLRGEPGAAIRAPQSAAAALDVRATGTRVSAIRVDGGSTGILVREVNSVVLDALNVSGAALHGIEIVDASARIVASTVNGLTHPMAQGIEVRNSDGRPDTSIEGVRVDGGQEGIVAHVSEVEVRDSEVSGTTLRGITITEMSDGVVTGNTVTNASGTGFYCGDMSRCAFENNSAADVAAAPGGRSAAGWGLVVTYHSSAWTNENELGGAAGPVMTSLGAHMRDRSPLDPASPADLVAPMGLAALVALVVGLVAYHAARVLRRRGRPTDPMLGAVGGSAAFLFGLGVQSFHMVEHWLQVYRIHVDHIPSRGGLVGPAVTAEWVHLAYNGALLFLLVLVFLDLRRGAWDGRVLFLGGAVIVQGWHSIEHIAKIVQHITTGAKVNPGLIGGYFDLVWFHFTINLAVYGLCVAAAVVWFVRARSPRQMMAPATA